MGLPPLLIYAGSWAAITAGVWALFQRVETVVRPEVKTAISRWLLNLNPATAFTNWPATFAAVFDRIFGERHLSWRCFGRSCVASFIAVVIVTLVWAALRPNQFTAFVQAEKYEAPFKILNVAVILNLIPDYFSLLETRYIIRWMSGTRHMFRVLGSLAFDLVLTAAIAIVAFLAVVVPFVLAITGQPAFFRALEYLPENILLLSSTDEGSPPFGIWFYSTFFTSVWVWLYALSGLVVKLGKYLGIGVKGLKVVLDIENKPLRSMGFVAMLLVTLAYLVAAPFVL